MRITAGAQGKRRADGFSILEVLLSICIATGALAILASQLTTQASSPRKAAAQSVIETAAATDLSWIRRYAQIWLAESGPFNIPESSSTNAITGASSFTQSSYLSYQADQPDPADSTANLCDSDAFTSAFLKAAESVKNSVNLLPNSIATIADSTPVSGAAKQIPLSKDAGTSQLWRKISFTGQADHITINYYLTVDPFSLGFKRNAAVLIEASAWCAS